MYYSKPVNPKKAKDNKPATNKLIGAPFIPLGILANILAKTISARAKPIEFVIAKNTAFSKLPFQSQS